MSKLPLPQAIERIQANDERMDRFANGGPTETWTTSGGATVPSFQKFVADHDAQLVQFPIDLASPNGSDLIGFTQSGTGTVPRTVEDKARERRSVADYLPVNYVTDGSVDYTADILEAIAAAGTNGELNWPEGATFLASQKLVMPQGQKWVFHGGRRASTLKKGYNGDLVEMGALAVIEGMNLDGNGATFTGRGIYIPSGSSQIIDNVRVTQTAGVCLEFASGQGGGATVSRFIAETTNPGVVPAIKIAGDSGPAPRFFDNIWLSGGLFDISSPGAGNGCSMSNFYMTNILFGATSALMHFANGRLSSGAGVTTVSGGDISFSGVAFSGSVALSNAQGMRFSGCTFGLGITEDGATCNSNEFTTGDTSYAVTWIQSSGTQPVLGNGTLTGWYSRVGRRCLVNVRLVIGSTTTFGNAATGYRFSLPFLSTASLVQRGMFANVFDASASTDFACTAAVPSNDSTFSLSRNGAGVRDAFPIAWATGDTIDIQFEYMVK